MSTLQKLRLLALNQSHQEKKGLLKLFLEETINKQGEDIRTLMKGNVKLQIVFIENESLKKMVAKLEDEIQQCKKASFKINAPKQD